MYPTMSLLHYPTIHKPTLAARPITAQHSYVLGQLSRLLSKQLNQVANNYRGIAINSKQVVNDLERMTFPPDCIFVTYDIVTLYPNIDIPDALHTLQQVLPHIFTPHNHLWHRVLSLIMTENYVDMPKKSTINSAAQPPARQSPHHSPISTYGSNLTPSLLKKPKVSTTTAATLTMD